MRLNRKLLYGALTSNQRRAKCFTGRRRRLSCLAPEFIPLATRCQMMALALIQFKACVQHCPETMNICQYIT